MRLVETELSTSRSSRRPTFHLFVAFLVVLTTSFTASCGGGNTSQAPDSALTGNTSVTILTSSTANDQLSHFALTFNNITLTNKAGKSVPLFVTPQITEFIHVNGSAEPLMTVSVPQDIYTSATASIGYAQFTCLTLDPASGGLVEAFYAYGQTPDSHVTVNLPAPITITGNAMGLSLHLLVPKSASFTSCQPSAPANYSITPTFDVTPVAFASLPTNSTNGEATNLQGLVASVNAGGAGFIVTAASSVTGGSGIGANPRTWQVTSNGSTAYQGISGFSQLVAGMPVDMDVAIQQDGSLLATRIAVYDTNTANLTLRSGPLLSTNQYVPELSAFGVQALGLLNLGGAGPYFNYSNAIFQTSGQLRNVQNLPFPASFTATNMVAGQNIFISTHALTATNGRVAADTVTLLPQTINGTVTSVSNDGSFATYTVRLANYDLFPTFAVQPGQTTLLTNPTRVVVYVDSNTQMLNTNPLAVGSVLRFNGMVFNDQGTLRMDCSQVNDGVAE